MLLVGRLVYEKGFQLALEALPGVIERVGNVRFRVAGSGTHEAELKAQAESWGSASTGPSRADRRRCAHSRHRIADGVVPSIYELFAQWRWRRWRWDVPASWSTSVGYARRSPWGSGWAGFNGGDRASWGHDRAPAGGRGIARQARDRGLRARAELRLG